MTVRRQTGDEVQGFAPGSGMIFFGPVAPDGWLLCQGQSLVRTDYGALFDIIGVTYGSVDGTHFTLPDLRENFPLGKGGTHALGAVAGGAAHNHTVPALSVPALSVPSLSIASEAVSGTCAGSVGSHTHGSSVMKADIDMVAVATPNIFEANRTTGLYTRAIQAGYTGTPAASSGTNGRGAAVDGLTDATTPTFTGGALSGGATAGGATGTGSTGTGSTGTGTTGNANTPVDPCVTVNFIIKY